MGIDTNLFVSEDSTFSDKRNASWDKTDNDTHLCKQLKQNSNETLNSGCRVRMGMGLFWPNPHFKSDPKHSRMQTWEALKEVNRKATCVDLGHVIKAERYQKLTQHLCSIMTAPSSQTHGQQFPQHSICMRLTLTNTQFTLLKSNLKTPPEHII